MYWIAFKFVMYRKLVVIGEMVDVERGSIVVDFTVMNVNSGSLEKPNKVVDLLQIRDVQVEEVLNGS